MMLTRLPGPGPIECRGTCFSLSPESGRIRLRFKFADTTLTAAGTHLCELIGRLASDHDHDHNMLGIGYSKFLVQSVQPVPSRPGLYVSAWQFIHVQWERETNAMSRVRTPENTIASTDVSFGDFGIQWWARHALHFRGFYGFASRRTGTSH